MGHHHALDPRGLSAAIPHLGNVAALTGLRLLGLEMDYDQLLGRVQQPHLAAKGPAVISVQLASMDDRCSTAFGSRHRPYSTFRLL